MFEINPSFENTIFWEDSLDKNESDGKLKFPVTFHDEIPRKISSLFLSRRRRTKSSGW
jgi:hypothetical protein